MRAQGPTYDLILVGSSFAASFFLRKFLALRPAARVLVLERGAEVTHADHGRFAGRHNAAAAGAFVNSTPEKRWLFRLALGGTSNLWSACTPRLTPEDFELRRRYGVAADWPLAYDDLERYYGEAEEIMAVSGPQRGGPWPRSRPYPQPPHRLSDPDMRLKAAAPSLWCEQPCARPTRPTRQRPACCATGSCPQCPVDSKFTVMNELRTLYAAGGVELRLGAHVREVEHTGGVAGGVRWTEDGREQRARGDVVAIGANAIFNPHLLIRSGLDGPEVGRGLVEQAGIEATVELDGVDGFGGSTLVTAIGYPLHDGPHRKTRAAALIESHNTPIFLRNERGRWRQRLRVKVIFEDLRQPANRVTLDPGDPDRPRVTFASRSAYTLAGIASLPDALPRALAALPIEKVTIAAAPNPTEGHVQCTTPMGDDPGTSVVDRDQRHHRVRNLLVLGASVFPTCPPGNPSLTLSALSLRAAERLLA
ncbi:MAG: GMC family oxidoreductase [Vicinamibacterales bacterium]